MADEKIVSIKIQTEAETKSISDLQTRLVKLTKERNSLNKKIREGVKLTKAEKQTLGQLQPELVATRNKLRDMERQVVKNNNALKKNSGFVAGVKKGMKGALTSLTAFGAGMFALGKTVVEAVKITKEFEQSNANLASVLGKTSGQIQTLTLDAKRLGAETAFSATQVSELQTEFAKLGFNEKEILNATEATLALASATGSDLAESASVAGATLGGFGLDAKQTQRVVDVMAKSFSTSALDMEKFKESMKTAGPPARAIGVTIEETTALLGTLANAGISGSKAGNALKNTFIELNAKGLTLEEGLNQVKNSQDKLGTATELVGKIASTSFLTLAEGTNITKELTIGLNNAGGSAQKMADTQLNTLDGRMKILNSAFEGLVLSLIGSGTAFDKLSKGIVTGATNMLSFFTATDKQSDALIRQKVEMTSLVGAITNANNTEETRKKLITELNAQYPDFLKNLDAEKVTNEQLAERLKDVNTQLEKKIILKKKEEELAELISKKVDLQLTELELIKQVAEAQRKFDKYKGTTIKRNGELVDSGEKYGLKLSSLSATLHANRRAQQELTEEIDELGGKYDEITSKINGSTIELTGNTTATESNTRAKSSAIEMNTRQADSIEQVVDSIGQEKTAIQELIDAQNDLLLAKREILWTAEDSIAMEMDAENKILNDKLTKLDVYKQASLSVSSAISLASTNRFEKEAKELERQKDQGLITETEYVQRINEIRKKDFDNQKKLSIANIAISLAEQIARIQLNASANPTNALTFGASGIAQATALTGLAVASSAVQAGAVLSQQYNPVEFEAGGLLQGPSHANGGIPMTINGMGGYEAEGGEAIINKRSTAMYGDLLSAINVAGGGESFASPLTAKKFATGGLTPNVGKSDNRGFSDIYNALNSFEARLKVVNVASETAGVANRVQNIENDSTFG